MARIDLSEPYERYLKKQVDLGLFRSVTSAAENAIRKQMLEDEKRRIASVYHAIAEGEDSITAGKTAIWDESLHQDIKEKAKKRSEAGLPVKAEVK